MIQPDKNYQIKKKKKNNNNDHPVIKVFFCIIIIEIRSTKKMLNCQIEQNPMTNMMMVKPCSSWKPKFLFIFLSLIFLMSFLNSALTVVNISTNNHSNEQIVTSTSVYSIVPITTVVNISEISSSSKRHRRYFHHQLKDSTFSSSNYFDSLPSLTSPLDFHWTNHLYYNNDDDYDYETNNNDGPEFSGPIFIVEPNIASSSERYYDNQTLRLTLTCKAQGYPIPKIYWRIDNMTIMNHHMNQQDMNTAMMMESETEYSWDTPQYWPHLNAMITLRNDGQTLIIGGTPMNNGNGNINQHHHQHLYQTGSNYIHHSSLQQPYMTISHQVECLAINRFGSIISKPIIVSQRQQGM